MGLLKVALALTLGVSCMSLVSLLIMRSQGPPGTLGGRLLKDRGSP